MAFVEGGNAGALSGTTEVVAVAAPVALTRRIVRTLVVHNRDTAPVGLIVASAKGAARRRIAAPLLKAGATWNCTDVFVLGATDESIVLSLAAPPATANPDFHSTYADVTP